MDWIFDVGSRGTGYHCRLSEQDGGCEWTEWCAGLRLDCSSRSPWSVWEEVRTIDDVDRLISAGHICSMNGLMGT